MCYFAFYFFFLFLCFVSVFYFISPVLCFHFNLLTSSPSSHFHFSLQPLLHAFSPQHLVAGSGRRATDRWKGTNRRFHQHDYYYDFKHWSATVATGHRSRDRSDPQARRG